MEPRTVIFWTDVDHADWIWQEMKQGRLRQGWAPPGSALVENGSVVDRQTWGRRYVEGIKRFWPHDDNAADMQKPSKVAMRYRILSKMLDLHYGDIVVVPRIPTASDLTVALVAGSYVFGYSTDLPCTRQDYGHIVRIDPSSMKHYGYGRSAETGRLAGMLKPLRSAITPVKRPDIRQLILKLAAG